MQKVTNQKCRVYLQKELKVNFNVPVEDVHDLNKVKYALANAVFQHIMKSDIKPKLGGYVGGTRYGFLVGLPPLQNKVAKLVKEPGSLYTLVFSIEHS